MRSQLRRNCDKKIAVAKKDDIANIITLLIFLLGITKIFKIQKIKKLQKLQKIANKKIFKKKV